MLNKYPYLHYVLVLVTIFFGGIVGVVGINLGNRLTNQPNFSQAVSLVSSQQDNFFVVEGEARLNAVPDQAVVTLGIRASKASVKAVQDEVNSITNQLTTDLKNLGVDSKNIKSSGYSLYPEYDWSGSSRRITGYSANSTLQVTLTNFELLNQVIDTATADGANSISGVSFSLSGAKQAELKNQARQEAIANAKKTAQELASLTGITLGRIINVNEYEDAPSLYRNTKAMSYDLAAGMEETNFGTSLEAGETTFTYHVNLYYQTL